MRDIREAAVLATLEALASTLRTDAQTYYLAESCGVAHDLLYARNYETAADSLFQDLPDSYADKNPIHLLMTVCWDYCANRAPEGTRYPLERRDT